MGHYKTASGQTSLVGGVKLFSHINFNGTFNFATAGCFYGAAADSTTSSSSATFSGSTVLTRIDITTTIASVSLNFALYSQTEGTLNLINSGSTSYTCPGEGTSITRVKWGTVPISFSGGPNIYYLAIGAATNFQVDSSSGSSITRTRYRNCSGLAMGAKAQAGLSGPNLLTYVRLFGVQTTGYPTSLATNDGNFQLFSGEVPYIVLSA